jgi:hypothetical protein
VALLIGLAIVIVLIFVARATGRSRTIDTTRSDGKEV